MVVVTSSTTASNTQRNRGKPVVMQRQVPIIQNIQKTVGVPQVHFLGKDTWHVRVVLQRQVPVVRKAQKTVEVRQVQYIDEGSRSRRQFHHRIICSSWQARRGN